MPPKITMTCGNCRHYAFNQCFGNPPAVIFNKPSEYGGFQTENVRPVVKAGDPGCCLYNPGKADIDAYEMFDGADMVRAQTYETIEAPVEAAGEEAEDVAPSSDING